MPPKKGAQGGGKGAAKGAGKKKPPPKKPKRQLYPGEVSRKAQAPGHGEVERASASGSIFDM
jgi:hypothetical protein